MCVYQINTIHLALSICHLLIMPTNIYADMGKENYKCKLYGRESILWTLDKLDSIDLSKGKICKALNVSTIYRRVGKVISKKEQHLKKK